MVEASNDNISLGTSLPGIVKTVFVKVGDRVKAGQPLFQIDDRELRADLLGEEGGSGQGQRAPWRRLWPPRRTAPRSTPS